MGKIATKTIGSDTIIGTEKIQVDEQALRVVLLNFPRIPVWTVVKVMPYESSSGPKASGFTTCRAAPLNRKCDVHKIQVDGQAVRVVLSNFPRVPVWTVVKVMPYESWFLGRRLYISGLTPRAILSDVSVVVFCASAQGVSGVRMLLVGARVPLVDVQRHPESQHAAQLRPAENAIFTRSKLMDKLCA